MLMFYLSLIETPEDRSKFEKIYYKYRRLMYLVAFEVLKNEQDAEDAVHEAFIKIAENMDKIGEAVSTKTKTYVVTIAENKAIDAYRSKARRQEVEFADETIGLTVEYTGSSDIADCLSQLPPRYRQVLSLKHDLGYSNREVANIMGISEANAIKMEQRAKHKLQELLNRSLE